MLPEHIHLRLWYKVNSIGFFTYAFSGSGDFCQQKGRCKHIPSAILFPITAIGWPCRCSEQACLRHKDVRYYIGQNMCGYGPASIKSVLFTIILKWHWRVWAGKHSIQCQICIQVYMAYQLMLTFSIRRVPSDEERMTGFALHGARYLTKKEVLFTSSAEVVAV